MRNSYAKFMERLRKRLLEPDAELPGDVRREIIEGRIVDEPLNAFVVRIRANASSITQEHIDQLKAKGFAEDQIFEATVCAAFRAGLERYQAAMSALEGDVDET
jgi:hypothetical protein